MKKRKKALLIALVLGDGYIRVDHRQKNPKGTLKLCHSKSQKEYLEYKVGILHSLVGGKRPAVREYTVKAFDSEYQQVRAEKTHRYFGTLRKLMYPDKYKMLKYMTPESIAIWFMDDGSLIANNRYPDGTCSSARTNIHTCCKTKEEASSICQYFQDTWDIKFTTFKEGSGFSIRCFHKEGKKFHKMIHPYVIPSMMYKQRFYYDKSAQPLFKGDDIV